MEVAFPIARVVQPQSFECKEYIPYSEHSQSKEPERDRHADRQTERQDIESRRERGGERERKKQHRDRDDNHIWFLLQRKSKKKIRYQNYYLHLSPSPATKLSHWISHQTFALTQAQGSFALEVMFYASAKENNPFKKRSLDIRLLLCTAQ